MTGKSTATTGLLIIMALLCASLAWSQANVDESLETATLYVDVNKGNDSNPGTKQLPLQTIGAAALAAVANNQAGIGTKVLINPGTYRESVTMIGIGKDTTLPITFESAVPGKAVMSGADISTGWKVSSGNANVYVNSWANSWGLCAVDQGTAPPEEDIVRRREMLIINNTLMTQVMTLSAVKVPGTFYVDETKGKIYVWPPTGTNMTTAKVEIPSRASLFVISGKQNMVIRGMTFQYANSCRGDAAVLVEWNASNVLVDNSSFNWNSAEGVKVWFTTYTTVQNSIANHNGASGMKGYETKYDLWQTNTTRYNGWRGAQGVYYAWGQAGMHFGLSHDQTIHTLDTSFNQTHGLHWDTDNENVTVDGVIASENELANGFFEKTQGPATISNSYFCSGSPYTGPDNLGFEVRNSEYVTLTGNTYYNNTTNLAIVGQAGGIPITNWETGQSYNLISQYLTLTNNVFQAGSAQYLVQDGALDGSDWTTFQSTLNSDYNTWWNATATRDFFVPEPNQWTLVDFAGWQSTTKRDAHSVWAAPSYPSQCTVVPDKPDYWFIMQSFTAYQTVTRGSAATFTVYGVPLNFNGNLTLSSDGVQNIPSATSSWSSTSMTTSGSATFTVTTSTSTPPGAYNITLLANAGSVTRTVTVTLTVQ